MTESIRDTIINKFYELSYKFGIKKLTIDMLASECGISKKTVYEYFKDKDEIVKQTTDALFNDLKKKISALHKSDKTPMQKLDLFFEISFNMFGNASEALLRDIQIYYPEIQNDLDRMADDFTVFFTESFQKGIDSGIFKNINPVFISSFLTGAAGLVLRTNFIVNNSMSVEEALSEFKNLVLSGIMIKQ